MRKLYGRFVAQYPRRIAKDRFVVIHSERFRDHRPNVAECTNKLRELILTVATPPNKRRPTRPSSGSKEKKQLLIDMQESGLVVRL